LAHPAKTPAAHNAPNTDKHRKALLIRDCQ
jgi:hypothetical protein